MKPSLEKLQKFFKLGAEPGYDNHAVLGGLERMLDHWVADAHVDDLPQELIDIVTMRLQDYSRLSPNSRSEVLEGIWRRIQQSASDMGAAENREATALQTAPQIAPQTAPQPSKPAPPAQPEPQLAPLPTP